MEKYSIFIAVLIITISSYIALVKLFNALKRSNNKINYQEDIIQAQEHALKFLAKHYNLEIKHDKEKRELLIIDKNLNKPNNQPQPKTDPNDWQLAKAKITKLSTKELTDLLPIYIEIEQYEIAELIKQELNHRENETK